MNMGRGAIVVGGAGGIGSDICRRFAAEGYRVTIADRNVSGAEELLRTLKGEGHGVVQLDVTNETQVSAAFDTVEARSPAAVLVVASGGVLADLRQRPTIATTSTADWNKTVALNLTGVFFCLRKFAQLRLAHPLEHTRIITISSAVGQGVRNDTDVGYVSSKAATIALTREAAFDLCHANITVNTVAPGPVGTPEFLRSTTPEFRSAAAADILFNRLATPDEIGAGVLFLASPEASFITGTTLDINGGVHMH